MSLPRPSLKTQPTDTPQVPAHMAFTWHIHVNKGAKSEYKLGMVVNAFNLRTQAVSSKPAWSISQDTSVSKFQNQIKILGLSGV